MKRLANYFFQGLIFLVPVLLTVYVIYTTVTTIDGWLGLGVPGAGFAMSILMIIGVGILANLFLTRSLLHLVEHIMDRLPFVKILHSSVKDLLSAVVGDKKRFDRPVLVRLAQGSSARVLGFVTRDSVSHLGVDNHVAVYLPQSYNFAGQLLIVPKIDVTPVPLPSSEVMTLIVSGGVSGQDGQSK